MHPPNTCTPQLAGLVDGTGKGGGSTNNHHHQHHHSRNNHNHHQHHLVDGTGGGAGVIDQSRWHVGGGRCDRPIPTAEGMLSL